MADSSEDSITSIIHPIIGPIMDPFLDPIIKIFDGMEPHAKYTIAAIVVLYGLFGTSSPGHGWVRQLESSVSFENCLQWLLLVGLLFSVFITSINLSGPLRYGINAYRPLVTRITSAWPYSLFVCLLLPKPRMWILVAGAISCHYVREQYREAINDITGEVNDSCSQAALAAKHAKEDAEAAVRYEQRVLDIAAVAQRDARLAEALKVTDFFDKSVDAWAAFDTVAHAARETSEAAQSTLGNVLDIQDRSSPGNSRVTDLYQSAERTQARAEEAEFMAENAKKRTASCQDALNQAAKMRNSEWRNAERVKGLMNKAADAAASSYLAAQTATEKADEVYRYAANAKAAAIKGDIKGANSWVEKAGGAKDEAVTAAEEAATGKENARGYAKTATAG